MGIFPTEGFSTGRLNLTNLHILGFYPLPPPSVLCSPLATANRSEAGSSVIPAQAGIQFYFSDLFVILLLCLVY